MNMVLSKNDVLLLRVPGVVTKGGKYFWFSDYIHDSEDRHICGSLGCLQGERGNVKILIDINAE